MSIKVLHPGNRGVNWCDMESSRFLVRNDGSEGSSFRDYFEKHRRLRFSPLAHFKIDQNETMQIHRRGSNRLMTFPDKPGWIGLDGEIEPVFDLLRLGTTAEQLSINFAFEEDHLQVLLSALFAKGVLAYNGTYCPPPSGPELFRSDEMALVELTRGCNIRCKHCFNMSAKPLENELSTKEVFELIDSIVRSRNGSFTSDETIALSGGEPLQHSDIFQIIDHVNNHGLKAELLTNGLLLSRDIIDRLSTKNVRIRVSLDGCTKKTHEWMRGKGTFEPTVFAIKQAVAANLDVGVTTSVSNHNISEAHEMVDFVNRLGIDFFQFIIVNHLGRAAKRDMFAGGHAKFYNALFELSKKDPSFRRAMEESTLGNMIACSVSGLFFHHCGLGYQKNYYVQSDGDIFPCRATILPEFKLGNVADGDFNSFDLDDHATLKEFRKMGVDTLNKTCSSCDFRYWCAGDCRGETLQATGNIDVVHPSCNDLIQGFETILWMAVSSPDLYYEKSESFYRRTKRTDSISSLIN